MIKEEGDKYWENRKGEFTKEKMKNYRDGKYREAPQVLREKQINLLQEIKWICRKHDTDVKIIISPDYLQVNINPADVKTLKRFFGFVQEDIIDCRPDACHGRKYGIGLEGLRHQGDAGQVADSLCHSQPAGRRASGKAVPWR